MRKEMVVSIEEMQNIQGNPLPRNPAAEIIAMGNDTVFEIPARYTILRQVGSGAQGTVW